MDRDQNLVAVTMDPHRVVVVLVLVDSGRELNIDVLADACRDHTLLLIANFEEVGLRRQNMQALRRGRVVDQAKFHSVGLVGLEARKFDHAGRGAENAIRADSIVDELFRDTDTLVRLCLRNDAPLNFNLILTVRRRLAH